MPDVFIALGSNLNSPKDQVKKAIQALKDLPDCRFIDSSSLYQSKAIGPGNADFINAVVQLNTNLSALETFKQLQNLEKDLGRSKQQRWGDRSIDLDLILYGQQIIDYPFLRVPHPQFHQRNFVLIPLFELVPDLQLPFGIRLDALLNKISTDGLSKLDD